MNTLIVEKITLVLWGSGSYRLRRRKDGKRFGEVAAIYKKDVRGTILLSLDPYDLISYNDS